MRSHVGVWRYRHELYRECAIGQKGIFIARRYGTTLSLQSSKRSGEEVGFTVGLYFIFSCQGVSHVPSNISTVKLGRNVPAIWISSWIQDCESSCDTALTLSVHRCRRSRLEIRSGCHPKEIRIHYNPMWTRGPSKNNNSDDNNDDSEHPVMQGLVSGGSCPRPSHGRCKAGPGRRGVSTPSKRCEAPGQ